MKPRGWSCWTCGGRTRLALVDLYNNSAIVEGSPCIPSGTESAFSPCSMEPQAWSYWSCRGWTRLAQADIAPTSAIVEGSPCIPSGTESVFSPCSMEPTRLVLLDVLEDGLDLRRKNTFSAVGLGQERTPFLSTQHSA